MKILVGCCWAPEQGQGISTVSKEIASALARNGHEVIYLCPGAVDAGWFEESGVQHVTCGPSLNAASGADEVVRLCDEWRPDLVFNNDHPYLQAALPAIHATRIVLMHTLDWGTFSLATKNHEFVDHVLVLSMDMWKHAVEKGVDPKKLRLIANGLRDPLESNGFEVRGADEEPLRAIFGGSWTTVKGADLLIDAFRKRTNFESWLRIDCFGEGRLMKTAASMSVPGLHIHGRVLRKNVLAALQNADVLLFPSRKEGCPMTVIEAMAFGVVPIVSDGKGAMSNMVSSGIDGFVCRTGDWATEMWSLLEYLAGNRNYLRALKQRARDKFMDSFEIARLTKTIEMLANIPTDARVNKQMDRLAYFRWHRPSPAMPALERFVAKVAYKAGIIITTR